MALTLSIFKLVFTSKLNSRKVMTFKTALQSQRQVGTGLFVKLLQCWILKPSVSFMLKTEADTGQWRVVIAFVQELQSHQLLNSRLVFMIFCISCLLGFFQCCKRYFILRKMSSFQHLFLGSSIRCYTDGHFLHSLSPPF